MMIEEGLLADMLDHRDEDGPRLVCADWYEDHGEPERAELVRAQCLLARLPAEAPEQAGLEARERDLLAAHEGRWAEPLAGFGVAEWRFERGFIESVEVDRLAAVRWGMEEMCRLAPLRNVRIVDPIDRDDYDIDDLLAGLPGMRRLEGLEVVRVPRPRASGAFHARVSELLSSPHLAQLRRLALSFEYLEPEAFDALLDGPVWPGLEWLSLDSFNGDFTPQMGRLVTRLRGSPLPVLCLYVSLESVADLVRFLEVLPRSRLESLSLNCDLAERGSDEGLRQLPWARWLKGLRWLSVSGWGTSAVCQAIHQSGAWPQGQAPWDGPEWYRLWRGRRWPEKPG